MRGRHNWRCIWTNLKRDKGVLVMQSTERKDRSKPRGRAAMNEVSTQKTTKKVPTIKPQSTIHHNTADKRGRRGKGRSEEKLLLHCNWNATRDAIYSVGISPLRDFNMYMEERAPASHSQLCCWRKNIDSMRQLTIIYTLTQLMQHAIWIDIRVQINIITGRGCNV